MRKLSLCNGILNRSLEGSSTLELVIAIPLLAMLMLGMAAMLGLGLKSYLYVLSDWEMVDEVRYATQVISQKTRYASKVTVSNYTTLKLYAQGSTSTASDTYYLNTRKLTGNNKQPITGDSRLGYVDIMSLSFIPSENNVRMKLRAKNRLTGHTYDVDTKIYTLGTIKN